MGESDYEREEGQDEAKQPEGLEPLLPEEAPEPEPDQQEAELGEAGTQALANALRASFTVLKVAMIALVIFYLASGVFYVRPQEVRFKLRFGNIVDSWGEKLLKPGTIHIKWPWEDYEIVSTSEAIVELGNVYWTAWPQAGMQQKQSLDVRSDGYLLTGDANIVHMRVRARCRPRGDAEGAMSYKFAVEKPELILQRCLMSAVTKVVSSMPVMDVLKRDALFPRITEELRARVADFEHKSGVPLGLEVIAVEAAETRRVKNPTEPLAGGVSQAFLEAQNAGSRRDQFIEEGKLQANAMIESAQATAREQVARTRGYAARLVGDADADAEAMRRLLPTYLSSPEEAGILRDTIYQSAVQWALRHAKTVFVLHDPSDETSRELRLLLGGTTLPRRPTLRHPMEP